MDAPESATSGVNTLARMVRDRRRQLALTQVEIAELAGVHRNQVRQIEQAHATDYVRRLERVLDVLGLELTVRHRTDEIGREGTAPP